MRFQANNIFWIALVLTFFGFLIFLISISPQQAGDIADYFGPTQTFLSHTGPSLTSADQQKLEQIIHPQYFNDPTIYILGRNQQRYPAHFFFYSILLIPARLTLELLNLNPLLTFPITNLLIAFFLLFVILNLTKDNFKRFSILTLTLLSPLAFFLSWPGPDIYYSFLLLLSLFLFGQNQYYLASLLTALASWHSQPLLITTIAFYSFYLCQANQFSLAKKAVKLKLKNPTLIKGLVILLILIIPYLYNLYSFSTLTPWTLFKNGWTQLQGFGLQNISLKRFYEQFFDLNMGLFWYAPLITLFGIYLLAKTNRFLLLTLILTAFAYQTNPGWHFGTAGYGPTRHIIFALPFFIYALTQNLKKTIRSVQLITILALSQLPSLIFNNYLSPNFQHSLHHSPMAKWVLNYYPQFYNPTPEIFIERTLHAETPHPISAIYQHQGQCRKAYIVSTDQKLLTSTCPTISNFPDNQFLRVSNYNRPVWTTQATFWPVTTNLPTLPQALNAIRPLDPTRLQPIPQSPGTWKFTPGLPDQIIVPSGYIIHHDSLTGSYVNF